MSQENLDGRPGRTTASPHAVLLGAALLAVALALLTLAVAAPWAPLRRLDLHVADWGYRQTYGHPHLTDWWVGVALYGGPTVQRGLMLVLAVVLAVRRHVAAAVWLGLLVVVETVIAPSAKHLLDRPRPDWASPIAVEHSTSFPSGHATAAATFAVAVLLLLPLLTGSRTGRIVIGGVAVAAALTVCADRILLGVHYLSDVVGGMLLGSLITLLAWWVLTRVSRRR